MNIFIHDPYKINLPQEIPRTSQVITSSIPSHIRDTEQGLLYIITWRYLINKKYHAAHAPYSKRIGHKGPEIMKKYNLKIHSSHPQTLILFLLSKGSQDIITLGKKKIMIIITLGFKITSLPFPIIPFFPILCPPKKFLLLQDGLISAFQEALTSPHC